MRKNTNVSNIKSITNVVARGRSFKVILLDDIHYCAIEDKYIDSNGCLTKSLNGVEMYVNNDLEWCVQSVLNQVELDYLQNECGYTKAEAFAKVFNLSDDAAKALAGCLDE